MTPAVHIVAMGARTPVGLTAASAAAAVRARITRIAEHPFLADLRGEPVRVARDALLDPGLFGAPRLLALARAALDEVILKLGLRSHETLLPLFVGLPELRPGWTASAVDALGKELVLPREAAPRSSTEVIAAGHAAALEALRRGCETIQQGQAEVCIVGGVDSYLEPDTLAWLEANRQLQRAGARSAFHPGEGAGFLALAGERACRRLGLRSLGLVVEIQTGQESMLIKSDELNTGRMLSQVIGRATAGVRKLGRRIDHIYCDVNGERYRTEEWGFALLRTQEVFSAEGVAARVPASEWGDVGAASGALLTILATQAWERRYARGPLALVWASSEGGLRAAMLLQQPESEGRV
jgi:3-oxoacyl-[acyl-carrier-protein] synthase-1